MPNYLLAYHGGGMPETPEEQAHEMEAWMSWMGGLATAMVDGGNPVGAARTMDSDGSVREGGGANPITGYSVIQAESLNAAVELARGCPILASGGSVEIAETFNPT